MEDKFLNGPLTTMATTEAVTKVIEAGGKFKTKLRASSSNTFHASRMPIAIIMAKNHGSILKH